MAKIQAYSSVSVVDLTDVGSINLYCTSNQPTSVIFDPNQTTYLPNWSSSPYLVITPIISYNGRSLSPTATGVTITYTRKEGSGTATALTVGETVSNGILTVSANKLSTVSSGLLTYICTVEYLDPNNGIPISTQASLTYTLISQANELREASIIGGSTFLYNSERVLQGDSTIVLTAKLSNVNINQWQYQQSDGTFAAYPITQNINSAINNTTLNVSASESNIWLNNGKNAVIKLTTSDPTVYDLHDIVKIYDGAAGDKNISAVLTNDNCYVPSDANGTVDSTALAEASTTIYIYEGNDDVTSSWDISPNSGTGLTGTYNQSTHTYTPTSLTESASHVDFTCHERNGTGVIYKRYNITKVMPGQNGQDAVVYSIESNCHAINLNKSGVFSPTQLIFNAYQKIGNTAKTSYSGRFVITESTNGSTFDSPPIYSSSRDEFRVSYTPSSSAKIIKCTLYKSGGVTESLDQQSIIVTTDGTDGQNGQPGTDGLSVGLANYSDVIPCNTSGNAAAARDINIPFYAYKGITRVSVTATVGTLPTGVTVKSNTAGTTSSDGLIILTVASGATFGNSSLMSGDITITLSAEGQSFDQKYSWTKSKQASNGTSAVILQLYSEDGGYVKNGKNTTIKTLLTSGTDAVTPSPVKWYEFKKGGYTQIAGETGTSITITDNMVTDQMWLKCEATYNNKTYAAYYTIDDTTDPYTAYTFATVQQFKNSKGYGAIYTRVYQNGVEVDPIKSTTFSADTNLSGVSGDYYYYLDTENKVCVLKKYNGTQWVDATSDDADIFTYKYYRIDNTGTTLDTASPYKNTRCFYIDPSIINGRMQFICEVSN